MDVVTREAAARELFGRDVTVRWHPLIVTEKPRP